METNCSDTDMMKVLNRSLILIPYPEFYNTIKVHVIVYKMQALSYYLLFIFMTTKSTTLTMTSTRAMNMTGHGMEHMKDHQTPM